MCWLRTTLAPLLKARGRPMPLLGSSPPIRSRRRRTAILSCHAEHSGRCLPTGAGWLLYPGIRSAVPTLWEESITHLTAPRRRTEMGERIDMDSQLPPEAQQAPSASLQEGERTSLYDDREPEDHLPGGSPDDLSAFPQAEAAFLSSQPLPQVPAHPPLHATHPLAPRPAPRRRFPVLAIVCITGLIALTLGLLAVSVEAIATPQFGVSTATHPPARLAPTSRPPTKNQPKGGATPVPTMTPVPNTQPADWVPQLLPPGWTNANLSTGDALEAERTAMTFTDREMSLDYRAVGTRGQHGGTLTASVFILTTAARQ